MKNGVLYAILALMLSCVMIFFSSCELPIVSSILGGGEEGGTESGSAEGSKGNSYGFTSEFEDKSYGDDNLEAHPEIKDQMLELEKDILASGLKLNKIEFTNWGMKGVFWLGEKGDPCYVLLEESKDKDTEKYDFYAVYARIFDDDKLEQAKDAVFSFIGLTDEEKPLAMLLSTEKSEVITENYVIYLNEGTQEFYPEDINSSGITAEDEAAAEDYYASVEERPYKEIEVIYSPVENIRNTDLFRAQREERKPKAENGINVDEYGLSFYVPENLTANPYNGMLYVWEFYTGEYTSSGYPDGVDVTMKISGLADDKTVDEYIRNDSRPANSNGVTPFVIKEINGSEWYTCNNGKIYYYGAEFGGNVFEIEIMNGKTINGVTLESVISMLEQTLYFE
ncbi:MAG: hypothetical protein J6036_06990 [Clostridia bacterium]|nr:hypothetical protein [Clostridia bacterium]